MERELPGLGGVLHSNGAAFADLLPLTLMTRAARAIMTEGASLLDVSGDLVARQVEARCLNSCPIQ